jgi:hypothetical protein
MDRQKQVCVPDSRSFAGVIAVAAWIVQPAHVVDVGRAVVKW